MEFGNKIQLNMKKYAVTSSSFTGEVYYTFDDNGLLVCMELKSIVEPAIHAKLCAVVPQTEVTLLKWKQSNTKLVITEVGLDISFENFWNRYNYKVGKKEAEAAWKKLSDAKKVKAIASIVLYDKYLAGKGIDKIYPERYLKKERFEDEYK
jgi:hypothetical protein